MLEQLNYEKKELKKALKIIKNLLTTGETTTPDELQPIIAKLSNKIYELDFEIRLIQRKTNIKLKKNKIDVTQINTPQFPTFEEIENVLEPGCVINNCNSKFPFTAQIGYRGENWYTEDDYPQLFGVIMPPELGIPDSLYEGELEQGEIIYISNFELEYGTKEDLKTTYEQLVSALTHAYQDFVSRCIYKEV